MPSVDQCRRLLGRGSPLTDEEVEALRDEFAILAEAILDAMEADDG